MFRKSQTSTEFIVLFSIVLILSLYVISVLLDFSLVPFSSQVRSSDKYWSISDIGILGYSFNGTDGRLRLVNNFNNPILIRQIKILDETVYYGNYLLESKATGLFFFDYLLESDDYELYLIFVYSEISGNVLKEFIGDAPLVGSKSSFN